MVFRHLPYVDAVGIEVHAADVDAVDPLRTTRALSVAGAGTAGLGRRRLGHLEDHLGGIQLRLDRVDISRRLSERARERPQERIDDAVRRGVADRVGHVPRTRRVPFQLHLDGALHVVDA